LPKGWAMATLEALFEFKYGKGLPQEKRNTQGSIDVYGSNGIVGQHDTAVTQGPTIVVGRKGSVGEVHLSKHPCWPIDTTYFIDHFSADMPPQYWSLYLKSLRLGQQEKSSAIPGISRDDIYKIEAAIPPLIEQRRIVTRLEELLEKVDACQQRLAKIPVILKRFRQGVLAAACSGRLTADWREDNPILSPGAPRHALSHGEGNDLPPLPVGHGRGDGEDLPEIPESWAWVKLPDTGEMSRGKSRHRPRNHPSLFGGKYPFIQTGDIAQSNGKITSHKQTYNEKGLAQSRLWPTGTICITIAANIAESAILTYPACFPDSVVGIIVHPKKSVAEYVEYFVRVAKADLSTFAPATAQKNINIAILNEVSVPFPPLPEQKEIVCRVEALFTLADQLEARYQKAKAHIDRLTQSILAKAFRGELVPQDENDEPASMLLERIRAQRAENSPPKRNVISTRPKKRKLPPEPDSLSLAAEPPVIYAATIPQRILAAMQAGKEYSRAEIISQAGISDTEWAWAKRQLKDEGKVRQIGERRGARYLKA